MSAKIKKVVNYKTYQEVDEALSTMAALMLSADKKEIKMNQEILEIKKKYEVDITELRAKADVYENDIKEFCLLNKTDFKTNRSKELTFGKVGFRTCGAALKALSKAWNWARIEEKIKELFSNKYVVVKTKLNKPKILQDANAGILTEAQLQAAGCKIEKGEVFFIEIDFSQIKLEDAK